MKNHPTGRADLLQAMQECGETNSELLAESLGFEVREFRWPDLADSSNTARAEVMQPAVLEAGASFTAERDVRSLDSGTTRFDPVPCPTWRPVTGAAQTIPDSEPPPPPPESRFDTIEALEAELGLPAQNILFRPLAAPAELQRQFRQRLARLRETQRVDVDELAGRFARAEVPARVPRLSRLRWGSSLIILEDYTPHLQPFRADYRFAYQVLQRLFPERTLSVARVDRESDVATCRSPFVVDPLDRYMQSPAPEAGSTLLLLGDLGALAAGHDATDFWADYGRQMRERGVHPLALVPAARRQIPDGPAECWDIIHWSTASAESPATRPIGELDQLAALASMAVQLEPVLIRELRMLLPGGRRNPGLESALWQHKLILLRHPLAAIPNPVVADSFLPRLHEMDPAIVRRARSLIYEYHRHLPEEIRIEELLRLGPQFAEHVEHPELLEFAEGWLRRQVAGIPGDWDSSPKFQSQRRWALRLGARLPVAQWRQSSVRKELRLLYRKAHAGEAGVLPPAGVRPKDLQSNDPVRTCRVVLDRQRFSFLWPAEEDAGTPSDIAEVRSRASVIQVEELSSGFNIETDFWPDGRPPSWANAWGIDDFGLWAELAWEADSDVSKPGQGVVQRFRWILPGTFLMGSPNSDEDSYSDEKPQREVELTQGYWLAETPCTQDMWGAVTGDSPSRFKGGNHPVERVSWNDCVGFLKRLRDRHSDCDIQLPTEAQWEYACRAGTTTPRYSESPVGELGWYTQNSNSSTHPVGEKKPNGWGVFDMLGNVYEWCRDAWADDHAEAVTRDPLNEGPASADRVVRGGSWNDYARLLRSAYRYRDSSSFRYSFIGFRCEVQGSEPGQVAEQHFRQGGRAQRTENVFEKPHSPSRDAGGSDANASGEGLRPLSGLGGPTVPEGRVNFKTRSESRSPLAEQGGGGDQMSEAVPTGFMEGTSELPTGDEFFAAIRRIGLARLSRPTWAADWGLDEFGVWADLVIVRDENPGAEAEAAAAFSLFSGARFDRQLGEQRRVAQRFRLIPPGTFLMGSPDDEVQRESREGPQHEVTISTAFWLAETACPQGLWAAVMGENPSRFQGDARPVERVSWVDCDRFCSALNRQSGADEFRLPTEAEWEYACRAGTTTPFNTGENVTTDQANYYGLVPYADFKNGEHRGETVPCRDFDPNSWGLYQTHGNVYEWCADGLREYSAQRQQDPWGPTDASADRVVRGGSWDYNARNLRSAYRFRYSPGLRFNFIGFRCEVQAGELPQQVREGLASVERRRQRAEPGGDRDTASAARATSIHLADSETGSIAVPHASAVRAPAVRAPAVRIVSDVEQVTLEQISRPAWATAMGRDRFGLWAEFQVPRHADHHEAFGPDETGLPQWGRQHQPMITQRLRWIPPGPFQFGSPVGEPGRWDDGEFAARTEYMESGFWLMNVPVTQEFWFAVMGENPAQFKSAGRPVEQVSWNDCHNFLDRLPEISQQHNLNLPRLTLPAERRWEHACRAGTTAATYAGSVEYLGDGNAPALDSIAWYSGNCGVGWDLPADQGIEIDWVSNQQHEFETGGTRNVAGKDPNRWGLYDMLGNVYEWCQDTWHKPDDDESTEAAAASAGRVVRGGSWGSSARKLRSAYRRWESPDDRLSFIGFRCEVQDGEQRQEREG